MITNGKLVLIDVMVDSEAQIELNYDLDLETEYFGFSVEDLPAKCLTSHESVSDRDSDSGIE